MLPSEVLFLTHAIEFCHWAFAEGPVNLAWFLVRLNDVFKLYAEPIIAKISNKIKNPLRSSSLLPLI